MKKAFYNRKYSGLFWGVIVTVAFFAASVIGSIFLKGTAWFIYSSIIRAIFGLVVLRMIKVIYDRPYKEILSFKRSKDAIIAGTGFLIYFAYWMVIWADGIRNITGLTLGLFISRIILQQITTGFYEELHYRALVLEGYFYGSQTIKTKLLYGAIGFVMFGALHLVGGFSAYRFFLTGIIGFAFSVMYLNTRNIVIPMILHFVYDIFANLGGYMTWSPNSWAIKWSYASDAVLVIMFVVSLLLLFRKGEKHEPMQMV